MNINRVNLSPISINLLHSIYDKIEHSYKTFETLTDDDFTIFTISNREPLYKGKMYDFIPEEIQKEIQTKIETENTKTRYKKYSIQFSLREHIKIKIFLYYPPLSRKTFLYETIQQIYIWLLVLYSYSTSICLKDFTIYLYLLDLPKKFPTQPFEPIKEIHANTAFTTACSKNNINGVGSNENTEITIFRLEEWFKVLIHETFHKMGLDFSSNDYQLQNKGFEDNLRTLFPALKTEFRGYETYCEIWASLLNVLLLDFLQHQYVYSRNSRNNVKNEWSLFLSRITEDIHNERVYSLSQSTRILQHYGLKYTDLFTHTSNYKEETNVFSYFILKNVLFYFINDFLEWMVKKNKGSLQFDIGNLQSFFLFIKSHYNNRQLLFDFFDMGNKKLLRGSSSSLRMTCIE